MAAPIDPATRFIRSGSFGCVVEPALPNENEKGNWQQFPKNVSKLFRSKRNFNLALNRTRKAQNIMKNKGQRMNTYKHSYTSANNLPKTIRNSCTFHTKEPIWVSRLPHLGVSIADTYANKDLLRRIPFTVIVNQVLKLFQQVKALKEAKYIHGDIREPNVMIDPLTGVMTIIDFDWLLPKTEFLHSYPMGFYSNPPESLIHEELMTLDGGSNVSRNMDRHFMNLLGDPVRRNLASDYLKQYSRLLISDNFEMKSILDLKPVLLDALKLYQKKLKASNKVNSAIDDLLFETFDSYGLGFTLFDFLDTVYPGRSERELQTNLPSRISSQGKPYSPEKLRQIVSIVHQMKKLCIGLAHLYLQHRLTIDDAIKQFGAIPNIAAFLVCEDEWCAIMG